MKRLLATVLTLTMLLGLMSGCQNQQENSSEEEPASSSSSEDTLSDAPVTLNFMLNSPELTDYYNDMAAAYKEERPNVTIDMEILQNDYQTVLASRLNSGEVPDLFLSSAYNDNKVYADYIYILNDEPFMDNIQPELLASVTEGEDITGYPFLVQSHAFIYNKDLFEEAGITELPTTLDDYREVCEKLVAAGIQPFSTGFAEWWILPQTTYPLMSDAYDGDYDALFDDVESGKLAFGDLPQVEFALDMLDLIKEYGGDKPMESTNDIQISDLANGKVAMIHNGNWAEQNILDINPDLNLGYLGHPRMDGESPIAVDNNLTFRVAKDSENLDEVLTFLEWLTNSEYGQKWIPEVIKQLSPQVGAEAPNTQLGEETVAAQEAGNTCPWWIFKGPGGTEQPFGTAFQDYVAGTTDREATKQVLSQLFVDAYEAQQ